MHRILKYLGLTGERLDHTRLQQVLVPLGAMSEQFVEYLCSASTLQLNGQLPQPQRELVFLNQFVANLNAAVGAQTSPTARLVLQLLDHFLDAIAKVNAQH